MSHPHFVIFNAVALSATNVVKSLVVTPPRGSSNFDFGVTFEFTSTAAGTLVLQVSNRSRQGYEIDVAAAGSEDANTNGWVQRDLSPTATIAVTAAATLTATVKRRWLRWRFVYTNASGSGTVTARASFA